MHIPALGSRSCHSACSAERDRTGPTPRCLRDWRRCSSPSTDICGCCASVVCSVCVEVPASGRPDFSCVAVLASKSTLFNATTIGLEVPRSLSMYEENRKEEVESGFDHDNCNRCKKLTWSLSSRPQVVLRRHLSPAAPRPHR